MAKLIECIPNFSCSKEKDEATYNALVETAKSVPAVSDVARVRESGIHVAECGGCAPHVGEL